MQSLGEILNTVATHKRDVLLTGCANGDDDDLALEERPSRSEVSPGCLLKFGDDIEIYSELTVRYLCPGRGIGWLYAIYFDDVGRLTQGQFEAISVTDRIPADPNETPMPIFPEEPPPEEQP